MSKMFLGAVFIALLLFVPDNSEAKTDWPGFQNSLKPLPSKSSNKAELSADISIMKPASNVPDEYKKYSGLWNGWACRKQACDVKVAVEKLEAKSGSGVIAIADSQSGNHVWKVSFSYSDGELVAGLSNGDTVVIAMRSDGNLNIKKTKSNGSWIVGLLSK